MSHQEACFTTLFKPTHKQDEDTARVTHDNDSNKFKTVQHASPNNMTAAYDNGLHELVSLYYLVVGTRQEQTTEAVEVPAEQGASHGHM